MDRLTCNKPVNEMTMTELAHNGCYRGEDGWARYRDYDTDIDARVLAGKLLKRYEPEQPLPDEGSSLEELLFDELQYGPLDHAGALVALVYNMIWSMADMRERLAAYEDTGLEPEKVEATKNALIGKSLAEIKGINGLTVDRMIEIAKAEQQGRLVVLPCKVGDTVYYHNRDNHLCDATVKGIVIDSRHTLFLSEPIGFVCDEIGKTVFLTREEGEAALGGDGDG